MKKNPIATLMIAQGVDIARNPTSPPEFSKIDRHTFSQKFQNFSLSDNFRHVWEKSNQYLEKIATSPTFKRNAALTVAKSEIDFGASLRNEPSLTLEDKINQTYKLNTPKLQFKNN